MINESPLSVKTAYTFDSNYFNSENKIIFILDALQWDYSKKCKPKFLHFQQNSRKRLIREKN